MNKLIIFLVFLLSGTLATAQITFERTYEWSQYNDYGQAVLQTSDSGYFVAGYALIGNVDYIYYFKTDPHGNVEWDNNFTSLDGAYPTEVIQQHEGKYCIVGGAGFWLQPSWILYGLQLKVGAGWSQSNIYHTVYDIFFKAGVGTDDGGIVMTGGIGRVIWDSLPLYIIKTDSAGAELWSETFDSLNLGPGAAIVQTHDQGIVICGASDIYSSSDQMFLLKTDASGTLLWNKTFDGIANAMDLTSDSGFIIAATTYTMGMNTEVYLIKTNNVGDTIWTRKFGGSGDDIPYSIATTRDGGFIITGYTNSFGQGMKDAYLVKTDAEGYVQWTKTFGGSQDDYAYDVKQTMDGGYILTGETVSFGSGYSDVYLIKTDSNGVSNGTLNLEFVSSANNHQLSLSPNPTSGLFTLHFSNESKDEGKTSIKVFNMFGEEILSTTLTSSKNEDYQIDLSGFSKGIYVVQVNTGDAVVCRKIVLE
jgi:hypothetical protein